MGTALSGCIIEDLTGGPADPVAAKFIHVDLSMDGEDQEFEDAVSVWFEYRHQGVDAAAGDIQVTYTALGGEDRTETLSAHTGRAQIAVGDIVRIENVNITSGLVVRHGDDTLAERPSMPEDWFTVAGYPIPLASDGAGLARYEASASSGFEASGRDIEVPDGPFVESFAASFNTEGSGDLVLEVTTPSRGPRVVQDVKLEASMESEADVHVIQDGQRTNSGGRATLDGRIDWRTALQFDTAGALAAYGSGGSLWLDGDVVMWDEEHSKEEQYRPEQFDRPIFEEEYAFSETEFEGPDEVPKGEFVAFLAKLWAAGVAVGDEVRYQASESYDGRTVTSDWVVQVVAEEKRTTPAGTFDTWRVVQTQRVVSSGGPDGQVDLEFGEMVYWVEISSGMLVAAQADATRQFDHDDIQALWGFAGDDPEFEVPEDVSVAVSGQSLVELVEYSPAMKTSRLMGIHAGASAMFAVAAMAFVMVSDIGGQTGAAPGINLATNEAQDRLVVNSADSRADWSRIAISAEAGGATIRMGSGPYPYQNEPASFSGADVTMGQAIDVTYTVDQMGAGDFLEFCSEGIALQSVVVTVQDTLSNSKIGDYVFSGIAPC